MEVIHLIGVLIDLLLVVIDRCLSGVREGNEGLGEVSNLAVKIVKSLGLDGELAEVLDVGAIGDRFLKLTALLQDLVQGSRLGH